jgi:hypothetical protein
MSIPAAELFSPHFVYLLLHIPGKISFIFSLQERLHPVFGGNQPAAARRATAALERIIEIRVGHAVIVGHLFAERDVSHRRYNQVPFNPGIWGTTVVKEIVILQSSLFTGHQEEPVGHLGGVILYFFETGLFQLHELGLRNNKPSPDRDYLVFTDRLDRENSAVIDPGTIHLDFAADVRMLKHFSFPA